MTATTGAQAGWVCRGCAGEKFLYPPDPWTYCSRCGAALSSEEQVVALARLQVEAALPGRAQPWTPPRVAGSERPLMTIREVATFFGKTTAATYKMVQRNQLPGVTRVAGRIYVRRADLLRSLTEGRVPSPGRSR